MTADLIEMVEHLNASTTAVEPGSWLPLLRLLAHGQPVEIWDFAAATGATIAQTREAFDAIADTEYDEHGRITGLGLTLRPTQYHLEVNGHQLYTWCALDTLIFPALLGAGARIESSCPATSVPILSRIDAGGAIKARPESTVVSLVNAVGMCSVRSEFCNQVQFFASAKVAGPWLESHPGGFVMPLGEAGQLGRRMAQALLDETQPKRRTAQPWEITPIAREAH